MNARTVHAVLAAGVEDPTLIERWRAEPALLAAYGIAPDAIDLDGLRKFAGLAVKVRHNGVRTSLPATFRLLSVAGIEIEVFAAYAADRAARGVGYATTTEERAADWIEFLSRWLDPRTPLHAILWDLVRHERALAAPAAEPEPGAPRRSGRGAVPRIRGRIDLHELSCDPREVAEALWTSAPRVDQLAALQRETYLCYWRPGSELHVVELDVASHALLSHVDGARTIGALHRALGGTGRPSAGFRRVVDQLVEIGLIELGSAA